MYGSREKELKEYMDKLAERRRLIVLESFPAPRIRTNPYTEQLVRSFPPEVEARYFTWRDALLGRYDVFHLHWPEVKVRGSTPLRSILRSVAFLAVLLRIRLTRRALVRTLHDAAPHEPPRRLQHWLIGLSQRWTTLWIVLHESAQPPTSAPAVLAPLGDYRGWFGDHPEIEPVRGRFGYVGLVRRYKGVDVLLRAFSEIDDPSLSLRIVGSVEEDDLRADIDRSTASDPRITAECRFVPDNQLMTEVLSSELVVLPFLRITNSSSLLLALSLDRPVLAPRADSICEVADEVGPGWVQIYDGPLQAETLVGALKSLREAPPLGRPDFSRREWGGIGRTHAEAFEQAVTIARRRRP